MGSRNTHRPRTDYRPAPAERAVLEGATANPGASPRYVLAASIRSLNARIESLDAEQQAAIQRDWLADWQALTEEREAAKDDAAELAAVRRWAAQWQARLPG